MLWTGDYYHHRHHSHVVMMMSDYCVVGSAPRGYRIIRMTLKSWRITVTEYLNGSIMNIQVAKLPNFPENLDHRLTSNVDCWRCRTLKFSHLLLQRRYLSVLRTRLRDRSRDGTDKRWQRIRITGSNSDAVSRGLQPLSYSMQLTAVPRSITRTTILSWTVDFVASEWLWNYDDVECSESYNSNMSTNQKWDVVM